MRFPKPARESKLPKRPKRNPANKGKRTSKRRKKRKAGMRACDIEFSRQVRALGRCEAAGWVDVATGHSLKCSEVLQCAHIVSRRYKATRWKHSNALCLCAAHHVYWTHRPLEWETFVLAKIGVAVYSYLKRFALEERTPDFHAILAELKEKAA